MSLWKQIVAKWGSSLSENGKVWMDRATSGLLGIDIAHHEIHEGDHYYSVKSVSVANGAFLDFVIVTPNTAKWAHMILFTTTSGEATVDLFEGVTTDADGAALGKINSNRNSVNVSGVTITHTPTNPVGAVDLLDGGVKIGAGRNVGGVSRSANEMVLKRNTRYYLKITNDITGAANLTTQLFNWYEHIDHN